MAACMMVPAMMGCGPSGIKSDNNEVQDTTAESSEVSFDDNLLDPENPVKVTFYSYSLNYPSMKDGMEHLINEFNDTIGKEKGVIVEGVPDDMTKFKTDIQAGNQVDIIQHTFGTLDSSRESLGIQAYEDVFPEDELKAHFEGISENALSLGKIDGKTYGLAFTFSTPILYINGNYLKKQGWIRTSHQRPGMKCWKWQKPLRKKQAWMDLDWLRTMAG